MKNCNCSIKWDRRGNVSAMVYCRLHAATSDLLAAAKLGAKMLLRNTLQDAIDTAAYHKLCAAIAKAEGQEIKTLSGV